MMSGCKTKDTEFVTLPLPQHHERQEYKTDSVHITDSVNESKTSILQEVDSDYLASLGIIKPPNKAWLLREKSSKCEKSNKTHVNKDTVFERDTIPVPFPVTEFKYINELYWWQETLMWAGAVYFVSLLLKLGIYIYRGKSCN